MGGVGAAIGGFLGGDQAQNNYSGDYDTNQNQINAVAANENALAKQVQQQATSGASPADILAKQQMTQNLAQTQGLIGSQRGINPGLAARTAANAGAQIGQLGAGQMAAQRAQEQNQANALQSQIYGNEGNMYAGLQSSTAQASQAQGKQNSGMLGGFLNSVTGGLFHEGGKVQGYDDGGQVQGSQGPSYLDILKGIYGTDQSAPAQAKPSQPQNTGDTQSSFQSGQAAGKAAMGLGNLAYAGLNKLFSPSATTMAGGAGDSMGAAGGADLMEGGGMGDAGLTMLANEGGKVPAMVSPGEKYIPPKEAKEVAKGEKSIKEAGKVIPGKAKVKGDDPKNDTVKANLDEGGIVIPREVMHSDDPVKEGTKFLVKALKGKKEEIDFHSALRKACGGKV